MYADVKVKLEVGKAKREIPYTIGVQQGDNMAGLLFIFCMQAFAETLEEKWNDEWGIDLPQYRHMVSLLELPQHNWEPQDPYHLRSYGVPLPFPPFRPNILNRGLFRDLSPATLHYLDCPASHRS
jgi:hypothetical protein